MPLLLQSIKLYHLYSCTVSTREAMPIASNGNLVNHPIDHQVPSSPEISMRLSGHIRLAARSWTNYWDSKACYSHTAHDI